MDSGVGSASDLLSSLDLNKNMNDMDMDIDQTEVSDVCERKWREVGEFEFHPYNCNPRKASAKNKSIHTRKWKNHGNHIVDVNSSGSARKDAECRSRSAGLARFISRTLDMESSSLPENAIIDMDGTEIKESGGDESSFVNSENHDSPGSHHLRRRGSRRKKGKERYAALDEGDKTLSGRDNGKKVVLDDDSFTYRRNHNVWKKKSDQLNTSKSSSSNDFDEKYLDSSASGHAAASELHSADNIDFQNISQFEPDVLFPKHNHPDVVRKNSGERRLGQNDAKNTWVPKIVHSEALKIVHSECSKGPSHQMSIPDSEDSDARRNKGKMILGGNFNNEKQKWKAKPHSRGCSIAGKEVVIIAEDEKSNRSSRGGPLRSTHDLVKKIPVYTLEESPGVSKRGKRPSNCLPDQSYYIPTECRDHVNHLSARKELAAPHSRLNTNALRAPSVPEPENLRRQRCKKLVKDRRKNSSILSRYGDYSSATTNDSEASFLQFSGHYPISEYTRDLYLERYGPSFVPVVDLDEFPEQSHTVPVQSSTTVSQVESDEIIARELQEQFDHELASFGGLEGDAAVAWTLQQDDAYQSSSMARRSPLNHRDASMAHLYAYYGGLPQSRNRDQMATSSRIDYDYLDMDYEARMMSEGRRNANITHMRQQMRDDFLEALGAFEEDSSDLFSANILQRHNFDENDYELLLALDENIHQRSAASKTQINSLPQSVVQTDNMVDSCTICLETPTAGEVIRLLPCLHKFHKECIDTWLRRKASCPVCKFDIRT